jgi:hypothetical protein
MKVRPRRPSPRPALEILEDRCLPATFTVSSVADNGGIDPAPKAGTGTLRQAIVDANATPGPNTIQFQIGTGPQTIKLQAALPALTGTVVLNGTTQPGYTTAPAIELDGSGAGGKANGLILAGNGSTVEGLAVGGFAQDGIAVTGNGNTLLGNDVGTDLTGAAVLANGADGIVVFGTGNTVGGIATGAGNLISGNAHAGVDLVGTGNVVLGNRIGTNAAGTAALGNSGDGIIAFSGSNTIGGGAPGAANLVSGNTGSGVDLVGNTNLVAGNLIGTEAAGMMPLPNGNDGVILFSSDNTVGGLTAAAGNLISGNGKNGIEVAAAGATGNVIQGNRVGTDQPGTGALANGSDGVLVFGVANIVGGSAAGAGNLISGNAHHGVDLDGNQNVVAGNLVGTDGSGKASLGNGGDGVAVFSSGNTLGGATAGSGDLISGNGGSGVSLVGGSNVVEGDSVGTDLAGGAALGNGLDGVAVYGAGNTVGGNVAGCGNLISANQGSGVDLAGGASGNLVQGNLIGTDATGSADLGNRVDGVLAGSAGNTIGDTTPVGANTIAFNQNDGLYNPAGPGNVVLQNNVFDNGPPGASTPPPPAPVPQPSVPQPVVTVPHPGRDTLVRVLDGASGKELFEFMAFPGWRTGLVSLVADLNGDGVPDIIVVSTGRRHGGRVRVVDGRTGQVFPGPLGQFTAFAGAPGGVSVSVRDINGDGLAELVLTARVDRRVVTKVYSTQTGALLAVLGAPRGRHRRHGY